MKLENFTNKQLNYFLKEDDDQKEIILAAVNRKPISKTLKTGLTFVGFYDYRDGLICLDITLKLSEKIIWHNVYMSDDLELELDGSESKTYLIDIMYETLWNDICNDEHGYNLLKRVLS